jgi:8-oxo-dGTP pyrophosphatase MutT (NUDIX family)
MASDLLNLLSQRLSHQPHHVQIDLQARPAAVLVPLYKQDDIWHVLYTRRTESVEDHSGQVSFPGGLIESEDESPEQAALRETEEELGILARDVNILGALMPIPTITQYLIVPIVGSIPWPYPLKLNQDEVATAFGVPLEWLTDPSNLEIRQWKSQSDGSQYSTHFFQPYKGEVIWGATARITVSLLEQIRSL